MNDLVTFAKHLADSSAQVIKEYFRSDIQIELKDDQSPVTIADRRAEEIMRTAIMQEFPDHGILGEEFGVHNPGARYQWVLDPIDGTKSFVSGSFLFGTLIALVEDRKPILGVISHPILDDFLVGANGQTQFNGRQVTVNPCRQIEDAILVTTSHRSVSEYQNGAAFEQLVQRSKLYRGWGDCHGYYLVATGGADIMTDPVLNEWDLMALIPIIEGAGGRITDWQGNEVIGGNGAVATSGTIHDEVIQLLNPL